MTATNMMLNIAPGKKLFLTLCAASLLLAGCNSKKEEAPQAAVAVDPNIVEVTEQLAKQIKLHTVGNIEMRGTLRVPGTIQVDEQRMARIGASVTGRSRDIEATIGQNVKNVEI